ncbi:Disease resistance protein TAO1 [Cardamine amara subsp. amara]|uniref:ADP-ribosyl cyclase/cyclic ADP-ribose hydrolase n=1 Tax=Cardamine amara subsp. amara TaxID=228776 RepID=A0ABD1BW30_CARAN
MIEHLVNDISNKLNNSTSTRDFDTLVGMKGHMERIEPLLNLDLEEVRMIGIWGPSGIGKTTIARAIYDQLSSHFQHSVFVEKVNASMYRRHCSDDYSAKLLLQEHLLSELFKKKIKIPHLGIAQERLNDKKVLIVLDGVDESTQLDAMVEKPCWFGPGSRIIITTQDKQILRAHVIKDIYKVDFPPPHETLEIFCMHAFRQNSPFEGFEKLAWEATNLAGKLPLGLEIMGSYFRGMSKQMWKNKLPMLRSRLDGKIASILKLSYDALQKEDKDLFLHTACFFNNESIEKLEVYLEDNILDVRQGLDILAEKSLISIDANKIKMHSVLVKLGGQLSFHEHGQHQFLVDRRHISEVLTNDKGNGNLVGMNFNLSELPKDLNISERAFEGLSNLQFLRFHYPIGNRRSFLHLPRGLDSLPRRIKVLHWDHFPMKRLPCNFNPEFLVELIMHGSKLEKLWEGIKPLGNLKWMDLSYSENLKELPDLSTALNLETLYLNNCTSLVELPFSIGSASKIRELDLVHCSSLVNLPPTIGNNTCLQNLDLSNCSSLVELPSSIGNLLNLEKVDLSYCSSLKELPYSIGNATNIKELDLKHCSSLQELPSSIGNLTSLQILDLRHCSSLVKLHSSLGNATSLLQLNLKGCSSLAELPSSIGNAAKLQKLYLNNCSSLEKLASSIGNISSLEKLDLSNCSNLVQLPSSIGRATNLLHLNLHGCSRLVKLPSSIGNLTNLKTLNLSHCSNLEKLNSSIGNNTSLEKLYMSNCSSLVELPSSIGNATNIRKLKLVNCSSLVELPSSIGNLCKLHLLSLKGCSKLKVLPININMESLHELDLSDCPLLKSFPKISTNIGLLMLKGTSIEEVSSSMRSWNRLSKFQMSYSERLKGFPYAINCITELHLSDIEIQEVLPWVIEISKLRRFVLNGCRKLVSIPQLSDSLSSLHAENCESLEKLDCSFQNPQIRLSFVNCFNLNKDARALIIHTPSRRHAILPGREVPAYFTYRATGDSLIVKLNERPLPKPLRFKACILLFSKGDDDTGDDESSMSVHIRIMGKQNGLDVPYRSRNHTLPPPLTEHLYTFEVEADVTSTELLFVFYVARDNWEIGECGLLELMEVPRVHEQDVSSDSDIGGSYVSCV